MNGHGRHTTNGTFSNLDLSGRASTDPRRNGASSRRAAHRVDRESVGAQRSWSATRITDVRSPAPAEERETSQRSSVTISGSRASAWITAGVGISRPLVTAARFFPPHSESMARSVVRLKRSELGLPVSRVLDDETPRHAHGPIPEHRGCESHRGDRPRVARWNTLGTASTIRGTAAPARWREGSIEADCSDNDAQSIRSMRGYGDDAHARVGAEARLQAAGAGGRRQSCGSSKPPTPSGWRCARSAGARLPVPIIINDRLTSHSRPGAAGSHLGARLAPERARRMSRQVCDRRQWVEGRAPGGTAAMGIGPCRKAQQARCGDWLGMAGAAAASRGQATRSRSAAFTRNVSGSWALGFREGGSGGRNIGRPA